MIPRPTFLSQNRRGNFLEHTLRGLLRKTEGSFFAERIARRPGLLQSLDPRVKVIGLLILILDATFARNFFTIWLVFVAAVLLAMISSIPIRTLATRGWLPALFFTGVIAIPVLFITPGSVVYQVPLLGWAITEQGLTSAVYLISRVETAVTVSMLLVLSTPWTHVLKGLRVLFVPTVFVVVLGMTYRYIFVLLETARDLIEARASRIVGRLTGRESRRLAAANVGVLLSKSLYLTDEVYLAMRSRGYQGEVYVLDSFMMKRGDWLALAIAGIAGVLLFWFGLQPSLETLLVWRSLS